MKITYQQGPIQVEDILNGTRICERPKDEIRLQIQKCWDQVAKPLDSMGKFEKITAGIGAVLNDVSVGISRKAILVFCADNGIVAEGISQSGQEVTLAVTKAMGKNKSSVGVLANATGTTVIPVDIGIHSDEVVDGVFHLKVRKGTGNFAVEPAMTREELLNAMQIGMDLVFSCKKDGYEIIGTGEMGIGNTTTSSAVIASLLHKSAAEVTGRGAGLTTDGWKRKKDIIEKCIASYELYEQDPGTVLQLVGGLDLAGLVGAILGGAMYHVPIVLDGLITLAAALVACKILPEAAEFIFASHEGREPAIGMVIKELELQPVIYGDMALGEGTGGAMFFALLDMALDLYHTQMTFDEMKIEAYSHLS